MAQLVKTMAGLAIASVKTVNGLAIASAKTIAGLDNTGGGSDVPAGALLSQDFESGSQPGDWTGSGTINWGQTSVVLNGTRSLQLSTSAYSDTIAYNSSPFSAATSFFIDFQFSAAASYNASPLLRIWDSGFGVVAEVSLNTSGTVQIKHGSATATTAMTLSINTHYRIWITYTKGSGANGVLTIYISTTDTKPASSATLSNGTATTDAVYFRPGMQENTHSFYYDRVRVDP